MGNCTALCSGKNDERALTQGEVKGEHQKATVTQE
jgi:hypothetical protein